MPLDTHIHARLADDNQVGIYGTATAFVWSA